MQKSLDFGIESENLFDYFEEECESADLGGIQGWLTSEPELADEYLRIRNPISSRSAEIKKQKAQAEAANIKIIKKLTEKNQSI